MYVAAQGHEQASNLCEQELQSAFRSVGATMDSDLKAIFEKYNARRVEQLVLGYTDSEFFHRLLHLDEAHRFGNRLSQAMSLLRLVADFPSDVKRAEFEKQLQSVEEFRLELNAMLMSVHPHLAPIHAERLMSSFTGKGVKIAVFDVFDSELLERQRQSYARASIGRVARFGNPVELDHGNSVIDVILAIAPEAEIVPVSSDSRASAAALNFLNTQNDIQVVNISLTLSPDEEFREQMLKLVHGKIVVKALGNSGTDLAGNLSPARVKAGLGVTGDLAAYDGKLIQSLLEGLTQDHLILGQNWTIDGQGPALSATVPGSNNAALARTVGAPADGIFSLATSNFESGASFAAPQIAAVAALLFQIEKQGTQAVDLSKIVSAILHRGGLINADVAVCRLAR